MMEIITEYNVKDLIRELKQYKEENTGTDLILSGKLAKILRSCRVF